MKEIILNRNERLALRAQAHHLNPVVLLGSNGLTDSVIAEISRELDAHELIKVRVPTDDREERQTIFQEVAEKLGAARVQSIGKLLVFWRPSKDLKAKEDESMKRIAMLAKKHDKGMSKAKAPKPALIRAARPKRTRLTKKAALA